MAQQTPREKGGRVIFIGNIPYGVSEEQIWDLFGRVGQPVNFRLVYDKETGKPKGFGFLEYPDKDQAAAAVRNLNGHEIMGRSLKVDYSNDNSAGKGGDGGAGGGGGRAPPPAHFDVNPSQMPPMGMPMPNGAPAVGSTDLPPLPQGVDVPPGLTAPDAISKTLQAIPAPQLLDILSQMKTLVSSEPQKATAILQQAPQLSYAIFQALLLLGLVDTNIIGSLIQQTPQQPPPAQPQPPQQMPPQQMPPYQQQPPPPQQAYQQSQQPPNPYQQQPPYAQPQPPQPNPYAQYQQQQTGYAPTPPNQHAQAPYQPPPPQYQQQAPQPPPQQAAPQQQSQHDLMQQVLSLTREQIQGMAPEAQAQILQLRRDWGAPLT